MIPILLPGSPQNVPTQPTGGGGEILSGDSNEVRKDAFELLLAEQLSIALVPQIQTSAVAPSVDLSSLAEEHLQLAQVDPLSSNGVTIPLHTEPLRDESTMPAFSQKGAIDVAASAVASSSSERFLEKKNAVHAIGAGWADGGSSGPVEIVERPNLPPHQNEADQEVLSPAATAQPSMVDGNSAPDPMDGLIQFALHHGQDESEPFRFSIDRNLLRSEMSKPPDLKLTAALPSADANNMPPSMAKQVPLAQHIAGSETQPQRFPITQATVEKFAIAVGEQQDSVPRGSAPPIANLPRTGSQLAEPSGVRVEESSEMTVIRRGNDQKVTAENSRLNRSQGAETLPSNDHQRTRQKEIFAHLPQEQKKSEEEGMRGNILGRAGSGVEDTKRHSGAVNSTEHPSVSFASHPQGALHAEPIAVGNQGIIDGARETSPVLQKDARMLMEQVKQALSLQVREQTTELRIRLQPESLGTMVVSVQQDEAKVAAEILVEHSTVKAAIDTQLPNLRQALQSQGLDLQRLEVVVADQSMGREFFHQAQTPQKRRARNSNLFATEVCDTFTPRSLGYNTLELLF
jgi:flagellar hook-length control protein FliK